MVLNTKIAVTAGEKACRMLTYGASGRIIGVFSKAIYCEIGSEVLLFHSAKWGEVPFGIGIFDLEGFLSEIKGEVGMEVTLSKESITFGKTTLETELFETSKSEYGKALPSRERIFEIEKYVCEKGSAGGILQLIEENRGKIRARLDALRKGILEEDIEEAFSAAERLVGLGRGLTPSGDDFLCGFLYFAYKAGGGDMFEMLGTRLSNSLERTSKISAAYLKSVISHDCFTIYERAAEALLGSGDYRENCDFVLEMGASSGTDTLMGMLFCAKLLTK